MHFTPSMYIQRSTSWDIRGNKAGCSAESGIEERFVMPSPDLVGLLRRLNIESVSEKDLVKVINDTAKHATDDMECMDNTA